MNEDHTYADVLDSIKIQAEVDENYTMLPGEVKILWQGLQDAQKDYQGMREFQEKFMKADHELREALEKENGYRKLVDDLLAMESGDESHLSKAWYFISQFEEKFGKLLPPK